VDNELRHPAIPAQPRPRTTISVDELHRRLVVAVALAVASCAISGGIALIGWRDETLDLPRELLQRTPFHTFLIPGLLLATVIGGSSLACAFLAWRRSDRAIDATLVAGGALTVWIAVESMLLPASWLQAVFGTLGVMLLCLGLRMARRSGHARHRWVIAVTIAETIGYLAPSLAGILSTQAGWTEGEQAIAVTAAGLVEGFALGAGQAWALPLRVRRLRYALLTSLGAGLVWATVMSAMLLAGGTALPPPIAIGLAAIAALVCLASIGTAQWIELRHHAPRARTWIAWTALAWIVALPLSFTPGPFVGASTPLGTHVVLWGCGGLLMAFTMALVTWQGVRALGRATASSLRR
jgi:hypothetical protein